MYTPIFKTSKTGIPILAKTDIDTIGEQLINDFCPEAMKKPTEIDIDRFITRYLNLEQDFQYLSHCGIYLGMMVFNDTDRIPVYNPQRNCAEYLSAKAGTVILDIGLLNDNQEHRYRFTAGHEAAHNILHTNYFSLDASQQVSQDGRIPMIQCRVDTTKVNSKRNRKTDSDWMEWQANQLASSLLMPREMVIRCAKAASRRASINAPLEAVVRTFNVSNEAAWYRLNELGLIRSVVKNSY